MKTKDSPWSWGIDQGARQVNISKAPVLQAPWCLALIPGKLALFGDCPFSSWIPVSPKLWLQALPGGYHANCYGVERYELGLTGAGVGYLGLSHPFQGAIAWPALSPQEAPILSFRNEGWVLGEPFSAELPVEYLPGLAMTEASFQLRGFHRAECCTGVKSYMSK